MNVQLGQTIDYTTKDLESSSYTHMKIVPLSGSQTGNEGDVITFELPVQAINLSRSYLQMKYTVPGTAAKYGFVHRGTLPISAMQLFTRGGQYLLNIQERMSDFSRVVISADSHREELDNGDESTTLYRSGEDQYYGENNGKVSDSPYFSQEVLSRTAAVNTAVTVNLKIPFSLLKHTILAVDKSILFREVLVFKIKLAVKNDIAFVATGPDNPATGAQACGNINFENICMYVAQERNANIVESLNVATESDQGFSLLVPYPTLFTNVRGPATSQSVSLRLNKSHGSSLKAVKHTAFNINEANHLRYDRSNVNGSKISTYYVNINNNRLTEYDIDARTDQYLDYLEHKRRLMDTPARNRIIYQRNWFHEDRFDDYQDKKTDLKTCDTNIMSGIDLNQEIRYDFYGNLTANDQKRHFSIVEGQKLLNINRNGIVLG